MESKEWTRSSRGRSHWFKFSDATLWQNGYRVSTQQRHLPPHHIANLWQMSFRLLVLVNCKKLNLCTNSIDKIANLNGLKNLVILDLARNNVKNLTGLDAVGDTLEQLWISYNAVEKLKGIQVAKKLKSLQITNNKIKVKFMKTKLNGHLARLDST